MSAAERLNAAFDVVLVLVGLYLLGLLHGCAPAPRASSAAELEPVCDVGPNHFPDAGVLPHPDSALCTFVCCNQFAIDGCAALQGHCEAGSDGVAYCVDMPAQAECE